MLTVIEKTDKRSKNRTIIWKCRCDCGKIIEARTDHLMRKERPIQSCGCIQYKNKKLKHSDD